MKSFILIAFVVISTVSGLEKICQPGSQFKDYCNACSCSADGTFFACTKMDCNKDIWNKDGSLKIVMQAKSSFGKDEKQVCIPNSQFKDQCNTCICSNDGLTKACTTMPCYIRGLNSNSTSYQMPDQRALNNPYCPSCTCHCNC